MMIGVEVCGWDLGTRPGPARDFGNIRNLKAGPACQAAAGPGARGLTGTCRLPVTAIGYLLAKVLRAHPHPVTGRRMSEAPGRAGPGRRRLLRPVRVGSRFWQLDTGNLQPGW